MEGLGPLSFTAPGFFLLTLITFTFRNGLHCACNIICKRQTEFHKTWYEGVILIAEHCIRTSFLIFYQHGGDETTK